MHEKAKCVCFIYMQPQKVKFKSVQINMKHVSYNSIKFTKMKFISVVFIFLPEPDEEVTLSH